jgi:predicted exporter
MRQPGFTIVGVLAAVLGTVALVHPQFTRKMGQNVVDLGDKKAIVETERVFRVPRYLSGILVVAGVLLVLAAQMPGPEGNRRRKLPNGRR